MSESTRSWMTQAEIAAVESERRIAELEAQVATERKRTAEAIHAALVEQVYPADIGGEVVALSDIDRICKEHGACPR